MIAATDTHPTGVHGTRPLAEVAEMYTSAIWDVSLAARHAEEGGPSAPVVRALTRAEDAINELSGSLCHAEDEDLAQELEQLFEFARERVTACNARVARGLVREVPDHLAAARRVLADLHNGLSCS